jgi:nicotinamide-nucleotide amidase
LKERAGAGVLVTSTLRILGVGEGGVEEQLGGLIHQTNPTVATYAKPDGVQVRISAKAADEDAARVLIAPTLAQVKDIFGINVFGGDDQTLGAMVAEHLQRWKWGLTSAERNTVGALSAEISGDATLAPYFKGGFLLGTSNPFAIDGMNAVEMAMAARLQLNAEVGVAVLVDPDTMSADLGVSVDQLTGTAVTNWNRGLPDLRRRAAIEALALLLRVVREADEAP